jgi:putative salt-induced outer membrane protein YdiY
MNTMRNSTAAALCLVALALAADPAIAGDPPKLGLSDTAELSYVQTAGNSQSTTFGFGNKLIRTWERALFTFRAGGIRAESTTVNRVAIGADATDFRVDETSTSALTAENYFLNAQYDRKITERFFWNAGAGWDRNKFAGIQNRYTAYAGVGNTWVDRDVVKFRTDYSLTYTKRDDVVFDESRKDKFAGFRFAWDYLHKFGSATTYTNGLVLDDNLQETSDWRGDMVNAVAVAMNKNLALKIALRSLYAAKPASVGIPLSATEGGAQIGTVLVPLDKLDTIFTTSLVVNW